MSQKRRFRIERAGALSLGLLTPLVVFAQQPPPARVPASPEPRVIVRANALPSATGPQRPGSETRGPHDFAPFLESIIEHPRGQKQAYPNAKCGIGEEERLQRFWHGYYDSLHRFYQGKALPESCSRTPAVTSSTTPGTGFT